MAVSNTDDHFRNHGFILEKSGWKLSPLYDVNPDIYGNYLSLNVNSEESDLDFELAIRTSAYYGLDEKKAKEIVNEIAENVRDNWKIIAQKYGINRSEIERMRPAFMICGE